MALRVRVDEDALPGEQARYWVEDDLLVIVLGRGLDQLARRRIIRQAAAEHHVHNDEACRGNRLCGTTGREDVPRPRTPTE